MRITIITVFGLLLATVTAAAAPPTDHELAEMYAQPSPFEAVPQDQWIAESANAYVIRSNRPQAPVHLLVIPKKRVPTLLQASTDILGEMLDLARKVAEQAGIARDGFRVVINTHPRGSQSVYHLHMHVLGGRQMKWPPG